MRHSNGPNGPWRAGFPGYLASAMNHLVLSEQASGAGSHLKIGDGYGVVGQDLLQEGDHSRSAVTAPLTAVM